MLLELNDAELNAKVLSTKGVVVIEFGAPSCAPCKALAPIMAEIAGELSGRAAIYYLDADANPETAAHFDVRGLPTILVLRDGVAVNRLVGARPKKAIRAAIDQAL
jgi:thioredoxin 1